MHKFRPHSAALTFLVLFGTGLSVQATTIDWSATAGTGGNAWNTGTNWVDGSAPANNLTSDIARFNQTSYLNQPSAPSFQSINGLIFGNNSTATAAIAMPTATNLGRFNIGASGIVLNEQSGAAHIGSGSSSQGVQLGASQSWTNNSSSLLTVTTVSNQAPLVNYVLTLNGSGSGGTLITGSMLNDYNQVNTGTMTLVIDTPTATVTTFNGVNTYSGTTTVTSGLLNFRRTSSRSANTTVTVAAAGSIGLGVGSSGFFNSSAVDQLFSNTLAGVSMDAASGVGIDTTNAVAGSFTYATSQSAARSVTKLGVGSLTLSGANTYSGTTTVNEGTLLVTGSVAGSGVTVRGGATLGGTGTVSSLVTVNDGGTLSPGNSPGIATYSGGLTLETGANFTFELNADTVAGRGTNYDGVNVTGGTLTLEAGVVFNLVLNGVGSATNYGSTFWDAEQSWLVFDNANSPSIGSLFTLGSISNDSFGNTFASTGGAFSFSQVGTDVYLNYTAVPEPTTGLLIAGALAVLVALRSRRSV